MNVKWILAILGCLLCLRQSVARLILVQAVFRHGNRAPSRGNDYYPNDPYINKTYPPMGIGGLTNRGKLLSYELGQFFRTRYSNFLGTTYSKTAARFRADEVDRIVMTGQLVAAGMFPPTPDEIWHYEVNWHPIPVWAPPIQTDYLYNGMFCENYKNSRAALERDNKSIQKDLSKYQKTFEYLSKHTGTNMTSFKSFLLRQQLFAQADLGLKLPEWTKSVYPNGVLDEIAANDLALQSYTQDMKRALAGVWLREWIKNIDNYLSGDSERLPKAYMYAAHEMNIAPILVALKVFDNKIPSYGSAIILELHEDKPNEFYVKLIHKNYDNIRTVILPGTTSVRCPLNHFKKIVQDLLPDDPAKSCGRITKKLL